jgi:septal ring factor EnvC (AmiA/AmiB activator)
MTESLWKSEAVAEAEPETQQSEAGQSEAAQSESGQPSSDAAQALAVSADDFSALEERVLRAVALVKQERQARAEAEARTAQVEAQLHEQTLLAEQLHKDLSALKAERDHVRQRVERLLAQLDTLEL